MKPRGQNGRCSKLSIEQIGAIRRVYRDCNALLSLRTQLCNELGITTQYFCRVGRGEAGKKPAVGRT